MENDLHTKPPLDVLIVTAVRDEYEAVLMVDTGAMPASVWQKKNGPAGREISFRAFRSAKGIPVRFAVTYATSIGQVATTDVAVSIVSAYRVRCLAMCGVCAGRRGKVNLGDVIVADRLYEYDTGKLIVEYDEMGNKHECVYGDLTTYNLDASWKQKAEGWCPNSSNSWIFERPFSHDDQALWLLDRLFLGDNPENHPQCGIRCTDWSRVLQYLWKERFIESGSLQLTTKGEDHVRRQRLVGKGNIPEPEPFRLHVAPIGTGNKVVEDEQIFDRLSQSMRKVLGLEMEAASIGAIQHAHRKDIFWMIVMKGVQDFADLTKNDNFRRFAARASAECLIAFLCEHLPAGSPITGYDDILTPGTEEWKGPQPPSKLLNARFRVVPFYSHGRLEILSELEQWFKNDDLQSGCLLYGPGGSGKTRLMIELCEQMREQGWIAGFLGEYIHPDWFAKLSSLNQPIFAVVDYAESRASLYDLLAPLLRHRASGGITKTRLILLARNAGDWWETFLKKYLDIPGFFTVPPRELGDIAPNVAERQEIFRKAVTAFAEALNKITQPPAEIDMSDALFNRPLYIHMAALAAVEKLPVMAQTLMVDILDHEERFWRMHGPVGLTDAALDVWIGSARQLMTAITLLGGVASHDDGRRLSRRIEIGNGDEITSHLARIYASSQQGKTLYLPPIEPDLLGEEMVYRTLYRKHALPREFIKKVFAGAPAIQIQHGLEVLGRISIQRPNDARQWILSVIDDDVAERAICAFIAAKNIAVKTAFSILADILVEVLEKKGTVEMAIRIERNGIPDNSVSMSRVAAWVFFKLMTYFRKLANKNPHAFLPVLAATLHNLGNWQCALGREEDAIASTEEAVKIRRELAKKNPDAFLPELARSLTSMGSIQAELGRGEDALASTEEAVKHYRELAKKNSDAFLLDLAGCLNNLSNRRRELSQYEAALTSAEEAVKYCRELAKKNPDAFLPELARSLHNLGHSQSHFSRWEDALASVEEAVKIRRELAKKNPDVFLLYLTMSLQNISNRQSELGRWEDALASAEESVKHYRELAKKNPDAFLSGLAASLHNLGGRQNELGRREDAFVSMGEAVKIRRELAKKNPDVFLSALAASLDDLGSTQAELGRGEGALASTEEAVKHYRELAKKNPDVLLPDLAMSLNNLGNRQGNLGRLEDALASMGEAVKIRRELAKKNPDDFLRYLSTSLSNLGGIQIELGCREDALASAQEAVKHLRELAKKNPGGFLPHFVTSLDNLGTIQSELGRREDALVSKEEAVKIRRELAKKNPDAFLPSLAKSLDNLGTIQSELGRREDALASAEEALGIYKPLFGKNPDAFVGNIVFVLKNVLRFMKELDREPPAHLIELVDSIMSKFPDNKPDRSESKP